MRRIGQPVHRRLPSEQLSQALRRLRRDWAFTAAFVVTLALGIAANLAVFSAIDAYFLRPLSYPDGQRLVAIYFGTEKLPLPIASAMSAAGYERLRSARALAESGLASDLGNLTVAIPGEPAANEHVAALTASTLETLGVSPVLGRWISPVAGQPGGPPEVDVSYRLWQSAFHGNPAVLGRTLRISGKPYTIVGVMPPSFAFPARHTSLWEPISLTPDMLSLQHLTSLGYMMIARLRPGASQVELHTELDSAQARMVRATPLQQRRFFQAARPYVAFMPLRQFLGGRTRGRLLMMQVGAGVLLLLAVASLINLALARALQRRDEAALRVILGAGRRVLLGEALIEALPLAGTATLIACPLTYLGTRTLTRFDIASISTSFSLHVGPALWVLALAAALILSSAALALPQSFVRVNRPAKLLYGTGKGGGGSHRVRPLRLALSVGQIGLAIALLAGALFLGRSLHNMLDTDHGFDSHDLYAATLILQGPQYRQWGAWHDSYQRLAAAVAALPGVRVSGIGEGVPFSGSGNWIAMWPAQDKTAGMPTHSAAITIVGPGLMKTLGVHLLAGRLLDASDTSARSIVIDESFADALFGSSNVVGKAVQCQLGAGVCRIVGVIGTIQDHFASRYTVASGTVFAPEEPQTFGRGGGATSILIRSRESPAILQREVRSVVDRILPDQSLLAFASLQELIGDSAQGATAVASLLMAFGLLAFALAIIGTYGVVAYVTGLRRREFAVRQAVGAEPVQIESLVLGQGLVLWALGTVVGVACAVIFARTLAADLYRVSLFSPVTYALPAAVVGAAVMLASWIPARGARKLDLTAEIRLE